MPRESTSSLTIAVVAATCICGSLAAISCNMLLNSQINKKKKKKLSNISSPRSASAGAAGIELMSIPNADGFRMPAEWEPHQGCWLLFPWRRDNWKDEAMPAQKAYAEVANMIQQYGNEQVTVGVGAEHWLKARELLNPQVRVLELACDDSWIRDSGPTFVVKDGSQEREVRGIDWDFNAYGGIYRPFKTDRLIARKVLEIEKLQRYKCDVVLEGGSIHVDGEGTCLTTEECLLKSNRNPGLSKGQIEDCLKDWLGLTKVIWLEKGLYGDEDTNGHIDNFACFIKPGEVLLHWTDDKTDPQYERSWGAYIRLTKELDAKGRQLRVHKMPAPEPMFYKEEDLRGMDLSGKHSSPRKAGERLAASYLNFYIANEAIIVPRFGDPKDEEAIDLLNFLFPDRKVVGVCTRDILLGGGNIHCITQQQPTNDPEAL